MKFHNFHKSTILSIKFLVSHTIFVYKSLDSDVLGVNLKK